MTSVQTSKLLDATHGEYQAKYRHDRDDLPRHGEMFQYHDRSRIHRVQQFHADDHEIHLLRMHDRVHGRHRAHECRRAKYSRFP